jgi:DNA processing protein
MIDRHLILHLTLINDIGPGIIQRIVQKRSEFNSSDLYLFSPSDWMHKFGFTELTAEKLYDGLQNKKILEYELGLIERNNIQWATVDDDTYPALLREIYLPPAVLYCLSSEALAKEEQGVYRREKKLAIVGARKADGYGQHVVDTLVPDLVTAGYTIVSGGARGIDTMAHQATLNNGGKTIAVLGSGLLNVYPISNKKLFQSIVEQGGLVVSAFPLTMEGFPGNFPARNRIITGLSQGCLVVQAAQKSGALISAHYAMEQGREVFAVPGPFDSELSAGCNGLIQNGAKLVMSSADILTEFGDRVVLPDKQVTEHKAMQLNIASIAEANVKVAAKKPEKIIVDPYAHCSEQQKIIIAACKQPISFDDIIARTQLAPEQVQAELFNLQLDAVIVQDFTGMWGVL